MQIGKIKKNQEDRDGLDNPKCISFFNRYDCITKVGQTLFSEYIKMVIRELDKQSEYT